MNDVVSVGKLLESCRQTKNQLDMLKQKTETTESLAKMKLSELDSANVALKKRSLQLDEERRALDSHRRHSARLEERYSTSTAELQMLNHVKFDLEKAAKMTKTEVDEITQMGQELFVTLTNEVVFGLAKVMLDCHAEEIEVDSQPEISEQMQDLRMRY
jgi:hypothetical protein